MVIGIIGAGLAGLTAGRLLANAGHDVTILEKNEGYGGRMATHKNGNALYDFGFSHLTVQSPEFKEFTDELLEKNLVHPWGEHISFFDGEKIIHRNPNPDSWARYAAEKGMSSIGDYLTRWVDVREETVGGLTFIGANRRTKRPWMVNLSTSGLFEADAIIIATPAPQAYGILQTTIDEINTLKIVRQIDEIHYRPAYSLMVNYKNVEAPEWQGILCQNSSVKFISNEGSKREGQEHTLVVHSNESFARKHRKSSADVVRNELLKELALILGEQAYSTDWDDLRFWNYNRALKTIDAPFFELDVDETPLALIGDYYQGNQLDQAYRSGYRLAKHWIEKYS